LKKLKWFTLGVAVCLLITAFALPALASSRSKTAELFYRDIKITLDGTSVTPTDTNGNIVEPFIIDGTTYLPVRAITNALGLDVIWDEETSTVILTNPSKVPASAAGQEILNKNGIAISYLGMSKLDSYSEGKQINLKVENNTEFDYTIQIRNLSINGVMCDSIFSCDVAAGKAAYDEIIIYQSYLDDIHVTSVATAEFNFYAFKDGSVLDNFESDSIQLTF
jgi:hypothetical protein